MNRSNENHPSPSRRAPLQIDYPALPPLQPSPPRANISKRRSRVETLIYTPPRAGHAERLHNIFADNSDRPMTWTPQSANARTRTCRLPHTIGVTLEADSSPSESTDPRHLLEDDPDERTNDHYVRSLVHGKRPVNQISATSIALEAPELATMHSNMLQTGHQAIMMPSRFRQAFKTTIPPPNALTPPGQSFSQQQSIHRSKQPARLRRDLVVNDGPRTPSGSKVHALDDEDDPDQLSPLSPNVEIRRGSARRHHGGRKEKLPFSNSDSHFDPENQRQENDGKMRPISPVRQKD
ncbi:hypothetical protein K461DRAFT_295772 [Myriangium duriaei CBS 260.36]|uniref:Uncharacterized protein n=1 Tax=Myriangium duriaei CBS 260.36 TaxID=1168546 RepID=A0A9P4MDY1_9PEZI|nr:hypothetical protein K461DRAFT_295772 [Myriangium duriaei CBS 260.36]